MPRTLKEITKDLESYRKVCKRQDGVTLYAEKYVEDVGDLVAMLTPVAQTAKPSPEEVAPAPEEDAASLSSSSSRSLRKKAKAQ